MGVIARSEDDLRQVVAGLGDSARYAVADVADLEALAGAIARPEAELGPTDVTALGPRAEGVEVGQRVVLNPWLCVPRGTDPRLPGV